MNYKEVIQKVKDGGVFSTKTIKDIGTNSLTRPIRNTGKFFVHYYVDDVRIHHKTGMRVLDEAILTVKEYKTLNPLCTQKIYKLKDAK